MPTVRRYGTRQVSTAALPGVRQSAAATAQSEGANLAIAGAETAQTIAQLGAGVARMGLQQFARVQEEERQRADEVAVLEYENRLARKQQELVYGEQGALRKKGKDSFGLPETVSAEFDQFALEAAQGLTTDRQRQAGARARAQHGLNLNATLHRHVFQERQQYEATELKAFLTNTTSAAITKALDPRGVAEELARAEQAIRTFGPRAGLGAEALQAQVGAIRSDVHVGVIDRLLSSDHDRAAKVYFEETRGQIDGKALANVEKAIEAGTLRGEAQRTADAILRDGGTLTEQRERARGIADAKLRDEVMQRIEHEAVVRDREERERTESSMLDAYNIIDRTKSIDGIPPTLWATFNGATRSAMRNYAEQLAKGANVQTDYQTYYALLQQAAGVPGFGSSNDFLQQNLLNYRHKLDEPEFKQLVGLQLSLRQGQREDAEQVLDGFRTNQQIATDTLTLAGIDTSDSKANKDKPKVAQFRRALDEKVATLQRLTGKKATNTEIQVLADDLLKSVTLGTESTWFGLSERPLTKRLMELTPADVPAADRQQIEAALTARGRPVTPEAVLNWYVAFKRQTGEIR